MGLSVLTLELAIPLCKGTGPTSDPEVQDLIDLGVNFCRAQFP
jgi:hypothetical protein